MRAWLIKFASQSELMSTKIFSKEVVVFGGARLGSVQKLSRVAWQDKRIDK